MRIIPPFVLKSLCSSNTHVTRTYFDPNPWVRRLYWLRLKRLLDLCDCPPNSRVLDYGCGQGVLLPSLSIRFKEVYGLDLEPAIAKKVVSFYGLKNVKVIQADGYKIPFCDGCFDAIFGASVFEHLWNLNKSIEEIKRVLKPTAQLLLVSPSENIFYQVGRLMFRYKKPKDHFHSVDDIIRSLKLIFDIEKIEKGPFSAVSLLSVYKVVKARKNLRT